MLVVVSLLVLVAFSSTSGAQESIAIVESRKFLPLLYQLAARVSKTALESDLFQQVLQEVREGAGQNEWK